MTRRRRAGFTLVEMLVALLILLIGLAIAAGLLGETQQMLLDAMSESRDSPAALVATRLRADVQGATAVVAVHAAGREGSFGDRLELSGPAGRIVVELVEGDLRRSVRAVDGTALGSAILLQHVRAFHCWTIDAGTSPAVGLDLEYRRSRARRSPLQLMPPRWGPREESVHETLFLTPRGGGLGPSW